MAAYIDLEKIPCRGCELHFECVQNGCKLYHEWLGSVEDVEPVKHGHWIITEDAFGRKFGVCSECGNKDNVTTAVLGHYCWFCGTKMDAKAD